MVFFFLIVFLRKYVLRLNSSSNDFDMLLEVVDMFFLMLLCDMSLFKLLCKLLSLLL